MLSLFPLFPTLQHKWKRCVVETHWTLVRCCKQMCRFHSRVEYSDGQSVLLQKCFLCLWKEGFQISLFPTNGSQVSRSSTFSIPLLFTSMENRHENSLDIPGQYLERPLTEYEREPLASPLWNVQNKEFVLISINLLARFPYFVLLWKLYWDFFNQVLFLISQFPFSPFLMTSMSLQRHSIFHLFSQNLPLFLTVLWQIF